LTIKDIARISGYGISTVSRVINNQSEVSPEARKKILEVIKENNFEPNQNAKHLKMQRSQSFGIIVKGTANMLFADILEKIQKLLIANGENAVVEYIDEDGNEIDTAIRLCRDRNPKGLFFLGGNVEYFNEKFALINVPTILMTNVAESSDHNNLSSISTNDDDAAKTMIRYLISKGHKNICILGGRLQGVEISSSRFKGCLDAFSEAGIEFDKDKQYEPCRFSMRDGYDAAKLLLKRNPEATAVFAIGDTIALGALRAINDIGKTVPGDISLAGFDGIMLSDYIVPRLTTIKQNTDEMAETGVSLMLSQLENGPSGKHIRIPFSFVEGESVASLN